jgi:hypothetical protein
MRTPGAAEPLGGEQVVGLEVQAGLDGEHHAGAKLGIHVLLTRREGAVVHVEAQVVRRPVHHPAAVVLPVLLVQGVLDRDAVREQPPGVQVLGDDPDRCCVDVGELVAGLDRGDAGLLRGIHGVVDLTLRVGEGAVHGEGAGDVSGEERVDLDAGVDAGSRSPSAHLAGVLDPVQGVGVVARRHRSLS